MTARRTPLVLTALLTCATLALAGCSTETAPKTPQGGASGGAGAKNGATPDAVLVDPAAKLDVKDQVSKGPTVNVAGVAATKGGFVVVSSDKGRNILGSGIVPAGTTPEPIQVSLAEEPTKKLRLIARLYADTNGDGLFGAGDRPIASAKGGDDVKDPPFDGLQVSFDFTGAKVINN